MCRFVLIERPAAASVSAEIWFHSVIFQEIVQALSGLVGCWWDVTAVFTLASVKILFRAAMLEVRADSCSHIKNLQKYAKLAWWASLKLESLAPWCNVVRPVDGLRAAELKQIHSRRSLSERRRPLLPTVLAETTFKTATSKYVWIYFKN